MDWSDWEFFKVSMGLNVEFIKSFNYYILQQIFFISDLGD